MITALVIILIALWFLGYLSISGLNLPNFVLLTINQRPVTLWDILILLAILWAISFLPRPFQAIVALLLFLWILSVLGIFGILSFSLLGGLPSIFVILIIVTMVLSFF